MKRVNIIGMGMGPEDLTARHKSIIGKADILVGGKRLLVYFSEVPAQKKAIGKNIEDIIAFVRKNSKHRKIVVLASGDPLFYGIGARMADALGTRRVRIYPNVSTVAAAFARIGEPWHETEIISLHGRKNDYRLFRVLESQDRVAILTDPKKNPGWLARRLIQKEFLNFKMCVFEALGSDSERFGWYTLNKAAGIQFAEPNMVVLKRSPLKTGARQSVCLGAPESHYDHQSGLITKSEIRVISLSKLKLAPNHILWDLGAGSGSISIEASLFIKKGKMVAVEKNPSRIEDIKNNAKRYKVRNLEVVEAVLPKGLSGLPRPDRIFIGGGGKDLKAIVTAAAKYLKPDGRIVMNTVLIENLQAVTAVLSRLKLETEVIQVQINRGRQMPWSERFESQNPVWIITGFQIAE